MSEFLEDDDVLSMNANENPVYTPTIKVSQVLQKIRSSIGSSINEWTETGAECEVLRASTAGWRKGKVRLCIEFVPDEPEDETQQAQLEDSETLFLPSSEDT
jgi:hypothetical protein